MNARPIRHRGSCPRRFSCPAVHAEQRIATKKLVDDTPSRTTNISLEQTADASKVPSEVKACPPHKCSATQSNSSEGPVNSKTYRFRPVNIKKPQDLHPSQPIISLQEYLDDPSTYKHNVHLRSAVAKNEAEIVGDLPINQRKGSLSSLSGNDRTNASFSVPGTSFIKSCQGKHKGSTTDSIDREIRSLRKNSVEERRLKQAFGELDKQSFFGALEFRNKVQEVFKEHKKVLQRSPSADEWLLQNESRTRTIQERERADIARRYSRRERHFRAPPHLQKAVSKIRSQVMFEAGLLSGQEADDELATDLANLNMTRRHTISGDPTAGIRVTRNSFPGGRRSLDGQSTRLAGIRMIQDVLGLRDDRKDRFYIDSYLNRDDLYDRCEDGSNTETSPSEVR